MSENKKIINFAEIVSVIASKKKEYLKILSVVFVVSCIWIFPQPRYYTSTVALAPEVANESVGGGLSSLASSFGISLGGSSSDAIYPMLYPDLFDSPEFMVSLLNIQIETLDGEIKEDYYTYLTKHQKVNLLTYPFVKTKQWLSSLFGDSMTPGAGLNKIDAFHLNRRDYMLIEELKDLIKCSVDKKTEVVTLTIQDQDAKVCALMADSVKARLQEFIINYRTSKARMDLEHYKKLANDAKADYDSAVAKYSKYCDQHKNTIMQAYLSEQNNLESEMQIAYNTYTAMLAQQKAMEAKVQEQTPAFTTLKSATIPIKPAGPKRMIFVAGMLFFAAFVSSLWFCRKIFFK
ncbi:MAG: chain-length determining protein [Bacteroidaceae bacterium]|nr:chain-length determining protein [Bacteroidaceae bacterium]